MAELFRVAKTMPDLRFESAVYNGAPATVIYDGDHLEGVFVFEIIDDQITTLRARPSTDPLDVLAVRADRQADRDGDAELEAYNARLRRLGRKEGEDR